MLCSPKPTKCSALPGSRSGRRAFFLLPGKVEKPFLSAVFVSPGAEAAPQDVTEEPGDGSSSSREQHGLPSGLPSAAGRDERCTRLGGGMGGARERKHEFTRENGKRRSEE